MSNLVTAHERARALLAITRRRAPRGDGERPGPPSWTRPVADLRSLLPAPFALTGGVATRLYMPERLTDDVDVVLPPRHAGVAAGALRAVGAHCLGCRPAGGGTRWRLPDGFPTDLPRTEARWDLLELIAHPEQPAANETRCLDLLILDAPWVEPALRAATQGPTGLPVLTLPYLALMKLITARLADIGDLTRMLTGADPAAARAARRAVQRYQPEALALLDDILSLPSA
ncbi:MAG TPA: hypothetical protein VMW47_13700 [Verrucomicrobiae bacterium]|nr:hypothetical protein [Verrucomicrobiae bacterium]